MRWLTLVAVVLVGAACVKLAPMPSQPVLPRHRDLLLSFDAKLFDQNKKQITVDFQFDLPASEGVDSDGHWNLEVCAGTGRTTGLSANGRPNDVPLRAQLIRYHKGLLSVRSHGSRLWSMRGDLDLEAEGYPSIEIEFGADIAIPSNGLPWILPPIPTPHAGEDGRAYVVRMMEEFHSGGIGGGLIYGSISPMWGTPPPKLPYMGFVQLTRIAEITDRDELKCPS